MRVLDKAPKQNNHKPGKRNQWYGMLDCKSKPEEAGGQGNIMTAFACVALTSLFREIVLHVSHQRNLVLDSSDR
jgi:hypothetical protein